MRSCRPPGTGLCSVTLLTAQASLFVREDVCLSVHYLFSSLPPFLHYSDFSVLPPGESLEPFWSVHLSNWAPVRVFTQCCQGLLQRRGTHPEPVPVFSHQCVSLSTGWTLSLISHFILPSHAGQLDVPSACVESPFAVV